MIRPSLRDRLRPFELIAISAVIASFVGLVVWMSSREGGLALVFGGITFIVCLMLLAMLALTARPDTEERNDIDQQNRDAHH